MKQKKPGIVSYLTLFIFTYIKEPLKETGVSLSLNKNRKKWIG